MEGRLAEVVELFPGATAIRKEMESLRALQLTLQGEEARKLDAIIAALEIALRDLLKGRIHVDRT